MKTCVQLSSSGSLPNAAATSAAAKHAPADRHSPVQLVASFGGHSFLNLSLDGFKIKARAGLHRRKVDRRLRKFSHDLLHQHEAPKLVGKPVVIGDRAIVLAVVHTGAFIGIEAQIGQYRPVNLYGSAEPTIRLIGEAVFEVIDAYRAQVALCEVENFLSGRRTLPGDQIKLIVAIEMHLEGLTAKLLTSQEFCNDIRI